MASIPSSSIFSNQQQNQQFFNPINPKPSSSSLSLSVSLPNRPQRPNLLIFRTQSAVESPPVDNFIPQSEEEQEDEWSRTRLLAQNVPWTCTADDIRPLFQKYGTVVDIEMLDYNVPGGKLNRGLSVVDSYQLLKGGELTDDEIFLASALGWCIEWLQAYFLVLDDIMDGSHTRRGQPCWFRLPKVGMIAANDGLILRNHVPRILKKHFRGKPYYVDLVDLFNEVEFQTASGQMIDLITTLVGEKDLSKYSLSIHRRIVQYKTAYYSFYLPVACALLMFGEDLDNHVEVKNVLVEMGTYFQVQDDYLDCFGAPEVIGKIGTDIEDFKCSWLVVKALELANEEQKKVLHENYGKKDPSSVAKVKELYNTLNLQGVFEDYESTSYKKLITSIEGHPSKAVQAVLKSFLGKIYKRQK